MKPQFLAAAPVNAHACAPARASDWPINHVRREGGKLGAAECLLFPQSIRHYPASITSVSQTGKQDGIPAADPRPAALIYACIHDSSTCTRARERAFTKKW